MSTPTETPFYRQPTIDRINKRLLAVSDEQFNHATDTIFNLLNIPKISSTEHTTFNNIRVNKQYIKEMLDISLLEQYTIDSYLDHVNDTLDKIAKSNTEHFVKFNIDFLKHAILHPTIQMLRSESFPIPPISGTQTDDPSYHHTNIVLKDLPCFNLTNHFDDNSNIIDTTYTIHTPGRGETYIKINETTKELIFLFNNSIINPSKQTDVDLFIHDLVILIKEIFTYLNTSYQYRKNSLSLKSLKTK